jgi:molybdopterin converting factor small subunit
MIKLIPGERLPMKLEAELLTLKKRDDEIRDKQDLVAFLLEDEGLKRKINAIKKLEKKIEKLKEELTINKLESEIQELITKQAEEVNRIGESIKDGWGKDTFKGKKDAIASGNGVIQILRSTKSNRILIPTAFQEKHKELLEEMIKNDKIKITLKEVEQKLGKEEIEEVCIREETRKYELVIKDGRNLK